MSSIIPVAIIAGGIFLAVGMSEKQKRVATSGDAAFHPKTYRASAPPAPLRERINDPSWGKGRYMPYKSFIDVGGLTTYMFRDPVTGQVRQMQQNDGFESI